MKSCSGAQALIENVGIKREGGPKGIEVALTPPSSLYSPLRAPDNAHAQDRQAKTDRHAYGYALFVGSLTILTRSLALILSLTHTLSLSPSLRHSLPHSLTISLTSSLTDYLIQFLAHLPTHTNTHTHTFCLPYPILSSQKHSSTRTTTNWRRTISFCLGLEFLASVFFLFWDRIDGWSVQHSMYSESKAEREKKGSTTATKEAPQRWLRSRFGEDGRKDGERLVF